MINAKNIVKKFGDIIAVNDVNLSVKDGEIFALLGVNGAGKSTLIKILSGLIDSTSGEACIGGFSIHKELSKVKEIVNVSPQETAIAGNLTVMENIEFIAQIYGIKKDILKTKVENIMKEFGLMEVANRRAKLLSGGMQRRLSIAMALITDPKVLFLDEPTLGLDVLARRELWKNISALKGKMTIILTTHYMEEAEKLADTVAIMSKGKVVAVGTVQELINKSDAENFEDAFVKIASEEVSL